MASEKRVENKRIMQNSNENYFDPRFLLGITNYGVNVVVYCEILHYIFSNLPLFVHKILDIFHYYVLRIYPYFFYFYNLDAILVWIGDVVILGIRVLSCINLHYLKNGELHQQKPISQYLRLSVFFDSAYHVC